MDVPDEADVSGLLRAWRAGEAGALDRLIPLVHQELRSLAAGYLRRERRDHTLEPTAVLHEAYLRLVDKTHPFDLAVRDSGAVLVGAGDSTIPMGFHSRYVNSNYGGRVDSYSWGQEVTTLGYGPNSGTLANCANPFDPFPIFPPDIKAPIRAACASTRAPTAPCSTPSTAWPRTSISAIPWTS